MLQFYHARLTQLEENIKNFKEKKGITNLAASTQALIGQTSDLESSRSQLQIEKKILQDIDKYLSTTGVDAEPTYAATLMGDPMLSGIYSNLLQVEAEYRAALKEYSIGHPKVMQISAQLNGLKEQLKEETTKRLSTLNTEISSVSRQIGVLQGKLENVPEDEVQLARLGRDRETAEKLYTFFAEKLEETRVQEAGVTSDLKIINPPLASGSPVNSKGTLKNLITAVVLSILGGGFAVFVADYLDKTVKDPDVLRRKLGLPLFGTVPAMLSDGGNKKRLADTLGIPKFIQNWWDSKHRRQKHESPRIIGDDVSSPEFESFRKLTFNLGIDEPSAGKQVIYITSPGPEEGKTFITLNLAVALAASGNWVVIADTDFRKRGGHLTDVAHVKTRFGIFDVLRDKASLKDVIVPLEEETISKGRKELQADRSARKIDGSVRSPRAFIDVLPTGRIPANPFLFLESTEMSKIVELLKETYDFVLIDGVPVLLFADAAFLSKFADSVVLTARYGKTGFKELEYSRDILLASKPDNIGLVMNGVPRERGSYYYSYYFKYYSKYNKRGKA
jgi:Mrp family chromosome partitioning ATPase